MKVCFVCLSAYPLISGSEEQIVGGAEVQCVTIARQLQNMGNSVTFLVYDHGQKPIEHYDGIKVVKITGISPYFSNKTILFQWNLFRSLVSIDSDYFYIRGGRNLITAISPLLKILNKRIIYSFSSDMDLDVKNSKKIAYYIFKKVLHQVDYILAQTKSQQNSISNIIGRDSTIVRNAVPNPKHIPENTDTKNIIIWVSTLKKEWKRPELFIELAKRLPQYHFVLIGGPSIGEEEYFKDLVQATSSMDNFEMKGFVRIEDIEQYFSRALMLVNTSAVEGFPNTYLQAWSNSSPVVTLDIDPDEIICNNKLGFHSGSFDQMVADVDKLAANHDLRNQMGRDAAVYVKKHHSSVAIAKEITDIINNKKKSDFNDL
jgi:glycosyltransferase involved in cell wall biosynthesis